MGRAKEKLDEKKLRSWKLLDDLCQRLAKSREEMPPPPEKRPGKRAMELTRMYMTGYVELAELIALLGVDKNKQVRSYGKPRSQPLTGLVVP